MTSEEYAARRRKCHAASKRRCEARIRRNGGTPYDAFRARENAKKRRQRAAKSARAGRTVKHDAVVLDREAQHVYQPRECRVLMKG